MQRSLTLFLSPFKDQSFLEKTPLSHVHNFLKECADFPLMITCENNSQPTIQPIEYSLMLNPPPIYEHLAIYSVNYIKRLNMITCPYFFTKYTTKPIYLWYSIFSPFVLIRSPYEISTISTTNTVLIHPLSSLAWITATGFLASTLNTPQSTLCPGATVSFQKIIWITYLLSLNPSMDSLHPQIKTQTFYHVFQVQDL